MRTWGSRFSDNTDELTLQYTAGADRSLYAFDIAGSVAHARMLGHAGIISSKDSETIIAGLNSVAERIQKGKKTLLFATYNSGNQRGYLTVKLK